MYRSIATLSALVSAAKAQQPGQSVLRPAAPTSGVSVTVMQDDSKCQMLTFLGNKFTFDVDVSKISCGLNGAPVLRLHGPRRWHEPIPVQQGGC